MPPLNQQQFFHGTHAELQPGDVIEPGHPAHHEMSVGNPYHQPDKVYFSPFTHVAAQYAWKREGEDWAKGNIYEVQPEGQIRKDPEATARYGKQINISYMSKRAKVVRRLEPKEWGG